MSLEKLNTVDAISIKNETGNIELLLADSMTWLDTADHLLRLQEKINTYIKFIESGEIFTTYPKALGRKIEFNIFFKYTPPSECIKFLQIAKGVLEGIDILLKYSVYVEN